MKSITAILFAITILILLFSGCTENDSTDDSIDDNNDSTDDSSNGGSNGGPVNSSWLDDYNPIHAVGTESNDFWINFPSFNPNSSQIVNHRSWVTDSIGEGCVLFVVHKTGCEACQPQADRVINLSERYKDYLVFLDLDITLGGSIEERAYDAYFYDADGPPGYIALTGIFTLVENNGDIEIGWHSWEKDVDYSELESWIKDAIYYYTINSED